jgi:subtilase family serine protease
VCCLARLLALLSRWCVDLPTCWCDVVFQWFTEASDPQHRNYQEFKSIDEITDLISPKPEETAKVMQWLHSNGVHKRNIKSFGDALDVSTSVKHAEKLFNTQFFVFQHATGAKIVRSFGSYSVPAAVKPLVEIVSSAREANKPSMCWVIAFLCTLLADRCILRVSLFVLSRPPSSSVR